MCILIYSCRATLMAIIVRSYWVRFLELRAVFTVSSSVCDIRMQWRDPHSHYPRQSLTVPGRLIVIGSCRRVMLGAQAIHQPWLLATGKML